MDEKFKNFEVIDEATITNLNGETNEKYKGYVSTLLSTMRMFELIPCSNKRKEKKDLTCSSSITLADRYFFALFEPFYTWKCVRRNGNGYRKNREKLEWEERYKDERLANDRNRRIDPTSCGNIERSGFLPCWLFSVFKHEVYILHHLYSN